VKRWTLKITLALLAGAVVTWAVAWGCELLAPGGEDMDEQGYIGSWTVPQWGVPMREWPEATWYSVYAGHATTRRTWTSGYQHYLHRYESGWPARAVSYYTSSDSMGYAFDDAIVGSGEWIRRPDDVVLGVGILPLGFTLNTLLAAGVILTLTEGAGAWRRRARRRKGRCPWCGYDRAGVAVGAACPECGRV